MREGQKKFTVRNLDSGDLDGLTAFFVQAYGKQTPFRSKKFLKWYFKFPEKRKWDRHASWIAVDDQGNVVSHYGCLASDIMIEKRRSPVMWGVNAYTLPEWRGLGINSHIVKQLIENNEINGVIGFTRTTAEFYQKTGYNVFGFDRMKRFVRVLNAGKAREVASHIGQDIDKFREIFDKKKSPEKIYQSDNIVALSKQNVMDYDLSLDNHDRVTASRDREYLMWRFLDNPFVKYHLHTHITGNSVRAMVVCRLERLIPLDHSACRIVDLCGSEAGVGKLVPFVISKAREQGCIYVDYSSAGNLYREILEASGFASLEDDECAILPQISSPIGQRPNHEYFGLQSRNRSAAIKKLTTEDVHLTRADSDRDRLGNVDGPVSRWRSDE